MDSHHEQASATNQDMTSPQTPTSPWTSPLPLPQPHPSWLFATYPNAVASPAAGHHAGLQQEPPPAHHQSEAARLAADEDRRRRNTLASARFRTRVKERGKQLETALKDNEEKVKSLEREVEKLERENGWLRGLLIEKAARTGRELGEQQKSKR